MITFKKATPANIKALSRKILLLLKDKESSVYQDNVAKFGIPDELVQKAFSEQALLEAVSGGSIFYIVLENNCRILGFAQVIPKDADTVELDRIVIFPESTGKGLGTMLLTKIINDSEKNCLKAIYVNAGLNEILARRFYEKNRFKLVKEVTVEYPWGKMNLAVYMLHLKPANAKA